MYKPLMILVAAMLIFGAVVPAVSAGSQTWYLTDIDYTGIAADDGTDHPRNEIMNKTTPSGTGTGNSVDLYVVDTTKRTAWWYAENAALCELSFEEYSWTARVYHEGVSGGEVGGTLSANVYKVASDGTVTHLASGDEVFTTATTAGYVDIACTDNASTTQDFASGERLAVRLSWSLVEANDLRVYFNVAKKPSTS